MSAAIGFECLAQKQIRVGESIILTPTALPGPDLTLNDGWAPLPAPNYPPWGDVVWATTNAAVASLGLPSGDSMTIVGEAVGGCYITATINGVVGRVWVDVIENAPSVVLADVRPLRDRWGNLILY